MPRRPRAGAAALSSGGSREGRDDVSQIFPWCFRRTTIVCRSFGCAVAIFLWNGSAVLLGERGDKGSWRTLSQLSALGEMTLHRLVVGDGRWIAWWTRGVVDILPHGEKAGEERSLAEAGQRWGLRIGDWGLENQACKPTRCPEPVSCAEGGRHLGGGATNGGGSNRKPDTWPVPGAAHPHRR